MCTAINWTNKDHYFGRNLDLEYHYNEEVVVVPRKFSLNYRLEQDMTQHYAMIGMATVVNDFPLFYEATNEHGLSMAGLNFPGNAIYKQPLADRINLAPFEIIPWFLGKCGDLEECRRMICDLNICDVAFNAAFPNTLLHWIIAYKDQSVVIEQTKDGLFVWDDPVGVLTNNPPFPYHLQNLQNYMHLSAADPVKLFSKRLDWVPYSRGMGAIGLPGDLSSSSRFVRAAFMKENSVSAETESASVSHFFHLLNAVAMPKGALMVNEKPEITQYSCCCNTNRGVYYYTTHDNSRITGVDMFKTDIDGRTLHRFDLKKDTDIYLEN